MVHPQAGASIVAVNWARLPAIPNFKSSRGFQGSPRFSPDGRRVYRTAHEG